MADHLYPVPNTGTVSAKPEGQVTSEIPEHIARLSAKEKKIWTHVTQALHEYGLIHRTDAIVLTVICRTFIRWVEAEEFLTRVMRENDGSYFVATPNGYEQPHQIFYVARNLKKELLQWLPEAALTIPSFQKALATKTNDSQGNLPGFEDPVDAHRQRKVASGMRLV